MIDKLITELDRGLKILSIKPTSRRPRPDLNILETDSISSTNKKINAKYMRVNHTGEICAQALYRGQAYTTNDASQKRIILDMCEEEKEHLNMLNLRMNELEGKTSYLNTLWYLSSFAIGTFVGKLEKNKSFGFIYETEDQVEAHFLL